MRAIPALIIAILLILPMGFMYQTLLMGRPMARDDTSAMVYPAFRGIDHAVARGHLYLWESQQWCGTPVVARGETTGLYPPTILLFAALPWLSAAHASYWLHLALGALGLFWVARNLGATLGASLIGAAAYGFSGYQSSHLVHFNHITALAYVPLMLAVLQTALRRNTSRWWALVALTGALAYLASHPMPFTMALTICLLWLIFGHRWREDEAPAASRLLPLALAAVVAGLLVTPQMLPMMRLAEARGKVTADDPQAALQHVSSFAFRGRDLPRVLLPNIYGTVHENTIGGGPQWHETQPFTGGAPLLLAIAGGIVAFRRRGWAFCLAVFVVGAALMPAEGNPIHAVLARLPFWGGFRAMGRWMVLPIMSIGLLSALGLTYLPQASRNLRNAAGKTTAVLAALIVVMTTLLWFTFAVDEDGSLVLPGPMTEPVPVEVAADAVFNAVTSLEPVLLVAATVLAAAAIWRLSRGRRPGPLLIAALLLAVIIPQWHLWQVTNRTVPREYYTQPPDSARSVAGGRITTLAPALVAPEWRLPGETHDEREISARELLNPALGTVWGVAYADGYSQGLLIPEAVRLWENYMHYGLQAFTGIGVPSPRVLELYGTPTERMKRLHRLAAVRHIVTVGEIDDPDLVLTHSGVANVYTYREPPPRWWLAREAITMLAPHTHLDAIKLLAFDPENQVIVDRTTAGPVDLEGETGSVELVEETALRLTLRAAAPGPRILVVADAWYPGWTVSINGEPAHILRANYAFRAVELPAGESEVTFSYRPASWEIALPLLGVGLLTVLALLLWPHREPPREGLTPP